MFAPLAGSSTGSAGQAGPHLQAWYDERKAAEEKQRELEGIPEPSKRSPVLAQQLKHRFEVMLT